MKNLRWNLGRQNATPYYVFPFFIWKYMKMDCYLIKIPQGSLVPEHLDSAKGEHYRFNIHFGIYSGGRLRNEKFIFNLFDLLYLFRPDKSKHSVEKVDSGNLYIFSVGKLK